MKISTFNLHRPVDSSDPGFSIPGYRLRWISGRVSESNPGRPWEVIKKSDLPPDLVKHILSRNPSAFSAGETIRRGGEELVLGYSSIEAAQELKDDNLKKAREMEGRLKRAPDIKSSKGSYTKVEHNSKEDATEQMIAQFKAKSNE